MEKYSCQVALPERLPLIVFKRKALITMLACCRATDIEFGWFGVVKKEVVDGRDKFVISECIIPPQQLATSGTCEVLSGAHLQNLVDTGRIDDAKHMRLWCHSHHSMGVSPSGQDEAQGVQCIRDTLHTAEDPAWYITAIFNHRGDINVGFYDKTYGIKINECAYKIEGEVEGMTVVTAEEVIASLPFLLEAKAATIAAEENSRRYSVVVKAEVDRVKPLVEAALQAQKKVPEISGPWLDKENFSNACQNSGRVNSLTGLDSEVEEFRNSMYRDEPPTRNVFKKRKD